MTDPNALLRSLWLAGRAAWPDVEVAEADFARFVGSHAGDGADLDPDEVSRLHGADLYLACACAAGDPRAIRVFDEEVLSTADAALSKLDPSSDFADEVRQRVRQRLLVSEDGQPPRISTFAGRGPLKAWVRVSAVRTALNLRGEDRRMQRASEDRVAALAPAVTDPTVDYLREQYRAPFEAAFERACGALEDKDRTVLRLRFVDGLNIDQIGVIYGVHRATVARWIARSRDRLLAETRSSLRAELKLTDSEFESLVALVRSQLDISISTVLGRPEDGGEAGGAG
jgi:RNA polymerase sigma-70 factor, ECF subfamily